MGFSEESELSYGPIRILAPGTAAGAALRNSSSCLPSVTGDAEYHEPACEADLTIVISASWKFDSLVKSSGEVYFVHFGRFWDYL